MHYIYVTPSFYLYYIYNIVRNFLHQINIVFSVSATQVHFVSVKLLHCHKNLYTYTYGMFQLNILYILIYARIYTASPKWFEWPGVLRSSSRCAMCYKSIEWLTFSIYYTKEHKVEMMELYRLSTFISAYTFTREIYM